MAELKCIVWNCGGLRAMTASTKDKLLLFEKLFGKNFHVAIFIETHQSDNEARPPELLRFQNTHHIIEFHRNEQEPYSGITILIHKEYNVIRQEISLMGRVGMLDIENVTNQTKYQIIAVYNYNANNTTLKRIQKVTDAIKQVIYPRGNNIVAGDFNFVENDIDRSKKMVIKDKTISRMWNIEMNETELIDPFRHKNPNKKSWSCISKAFNTGSRIDRVYVSEKLINAVIKYKHVHVGRISDHRMISFSIKHKTEIGKNYWKMDTSILKDTEYRKQMDKLLRDMENLKEKNVFNWWQIFLTCVKSISMTYTSNKNWIRKRLKNSITKRMGELEELVDFQNDQNYVYLKGKMKILIQDEIENYKRRIKFQSKFEDNELDISYYATALKAQSAKNTIPELAETIKSQKFSKPDKMIKIATKFYKELYTIRKTDTFIQSIVLDNVGDNISDSHNELLNKTITLGELTTTITQIQSGKTPGPDGIPIEFYQEYWELFNDKYLAFIQKANTYGFPAIRNTSATTIFYKDKGEPFLLANYRPISLINTDVKIISKLLANRLKIVLPTIIHPLQTGIPSRQIDQTIHLLRDMIDISNEEDLQTAFLFLDQEKAFDRVNHEFLFKTLKAFGFGKFFIGWIKTLYANASSRIKINGFFTERIPLKSGVRQGCPLSALLYAMVIEILALQLKHNQNIVGFRVGGERIVSTHYADDAVIIMKQNQCFKEVYKELEYFEEASGAKVNWGKTNGLFTGKWKDPLLQPIDIPFKIEWTNLNVENLGIFLGNDKPGEATYLKQTHKCTRILNFWKQFNISKIGKARVVEMFVISKLMYIMKFYIIPDNIVEELQKTIGLFIKHPQKQSVISQQEMWKAKDMGGIRLTNVRKKAETFQLHWLFRLLSEDDKIDINRKAYYRLMGNQPANIKTGEIFFLSNSYMKRTLVSNSSFYKNSLITLSSLNIIKHIEDPGNVAGMNENIFHNKIFTNIKGNEIKPLPSLVKKGIYLYKHLNEEYCKQVASKPHNKTAAKLIDKLTITVDHVPYHTLRTTRNENINLWNITHKIVYEDLISKTYRTHAYVDKWENWFGENLDWKNVWGTIHNNPQLCSNETITTIWQQVHLQFNTQYTRNKFFKTQHNCPLCQCQTLSRGHIVIDCAFTCELWRDIEPILTQLNPKGITQQEMALGFTTTQYDYGILLRNWLTFTLRNMIWRKEKAAVYRPNSIIDVNRFKSRYNSKIRSEIIIKKMQYLHKNTLPKYNAIITYKKILCSNLNEETIHDIFTT